MSATEPPVELTPRLLREWELPTPGSSKYERGRVVVVGGAAGTPGAVQLAGLAALRVGGGHLTLAVAQPVAAALSVATPEAGVVGLAADAAGSLRGDDLEDLLADRLGKADAVVVGPGLDTPDSAERVVGALLPLLGDRTRLVVDAFALGALAAKGLPAALAGRTVLTPNDGEAELLLGRPLDDDVAADVAGIAAGQSAVTACHDVVATPGGQTWRLGLGHPGLATSGSGDVLAGAVGGLLARGAEPAQAAAWAKYLHGAAGERLAARIGRVGFLAREILEELPLVLAELG